MGIIVVLIIAVVVVMLVMKSKGSNGNAANNLAETKVAAANNMMPEQISINPSVIDEVVTIIGAYKSLAGSRNTHLMNQATTCGLAIVSTSDSEAERSSKIQISIAIHNLGEYGSHIVRFFDNPSYDTATAALESAGLIDAKAEDLLILKKYVRTRQSDYWLDMKLNDLVIPYGSGQAYYEALGQAFKKQWPYVDIESRDGYKSVTLSDGTRLAVGTIDVKVH